MPDSQYRVVFISDLIEAGKVDVVKRNLATLFGTTAGNLDRLFGSPSIVLKKNLSRDEAERFRDAIIRCGAFCRIETMDGIPEVVLTLAEDRIGESMVCPRCFKQQDRSTLCRACGAIVDQYSGEAESPLSATVDTGFESVGDEDANRRYYDRRQDLETSVNFTESQERRNGRDRRRAHLNWRM